jgi:hypothetical protein
MKRLKLKVTITCLKCNHIMLSDKDIQPCIGTMIAVCTFGQKSLKVTNAPGYYESEIITTVKHFTIQICCYYEKTEAKNPNYLLQVQSKLCNLIKNTQPGIDAIK